MEIKEFTKSYIEKSSPDEDRLFKDFLDSKEPYTSIFANNPLGLDRLTLKNL